MYGGKRVAAGDEIFVFSSENEGGTGLIAVGVVVTAEALERNPAVVRHTPRVSRPTLGCTINRIIHLMEQTIHHQESGSKGAFFIPGAAGGHLAEMTYSRANDALIIIDHTDVDASLAGQGVGRRLLDHLVAWARRSETKVIALCPFAKAQFEQDPSIRDVLT